MKGFQPFIQIKAQFIILDNLFLQSAQLQENIWNILEKKLYRASEVSGLFYFFWRGQETWQDQVNFFLQDETSITSRDSEINFDTRGPKQLTGISFDNNSRKM